MQSRFLTASCSLILAAWISIPGAAEEPRTLAAAPAGTPSGIPGPGCEGGAIKDDGTVETGYGWIPSVIDGRYVQEYFASDFVSRNVETVCICWLRTRPDDVIDYEIVFYRAVPDEKGEPRPADQPYAVVPATATGVPEGITGAFYEVDVSTVRIPFGRSYVGARWDASVDQFFFICADHSPEPEPVEVFFIDDRAEGWTSVFDTIDPIFEGHRAIMVRGKANPATVVDVPALGGFGSAALAALLAALGWRRIRRRQR